jgi:hypothetical protein
MALRAGFTVFGAALLLSASASMAAEYRPEEFFRLDLAKAVLSPRPLGPPAEFSPVAVEAKGEAKGEAKSDRTSDDAAKVVPPEPKVASKVAPPRRQAAAPAHGEMSKGLTHRRLAHRRGNPLDAQAMDTRIQVWPCRSGGICNWRQ